MDAQHFSSAKVVLYLVLIVVLIFVRWRIRAKLLDSRLGPSVSQALVPRISKLPLPYIVMISVVALATMVLVSYLYWHSLWNRAGSFPVVRRYGNIAAVIIAIAWIVFLLWRRIPRRDPNRPEGAPPAS